MAEPRKRPLAQGLGRMLGHGVDCIDYDKMCRRIAAGEDYVSVCEELGDKAFAHAEKELKMGHRITAGRFFLNASAMYRVGEYALVQINDEKLRFYRKLIDSFEKGVRLSNTHSTERIELKYNNTTLAGWLFIPNGAPKDVPVVLVVPGLTGFKEEKYFETIVHLLERGLAVCAYDGPGQGETLYFYNGYQEIEPEKADRVIIDFLLNHPHVGNKIGVYGSSFGGYLAPRCAGQNNDVIAACVGRGGTYYPKEIVDNVPPYIEKFEVRFGMDGERIIKEMFPRMSLEGIAEKITCPLLLVHTKEDFLCTIDGIRKMLDEAASKDKELVEYPGPCHCADDDNTEATMQIADWLADKLL